MGEVPDTWWGMDHRSASVSPVDERFRILFDDHFADLWHFARRRCSSADEADDVAAETFGVAWRRRGDLPAGNGARLWLFGTARMLIANQRRSTGRRERLHRRVEMIAPNVAPTPDPADLVGERDGDPILVALATLTNDDRDLLVMRAWDGMAVTDIAALLDVTPNAVSVRLSKARTRLALHCEGSPARPPVRTPSRQGDHIQRAYEAQRVGVTNPRSRSDAAASCRGGRD